LGKSGDQKPLCFSQLNKILIKKWNQKIRKGISSLLYRIM